MTDLLDRVVLEPASGRTATCAVIWLHGLGADGHDFPPIVPLLELGDLDVRFVFPHAPSIPVTINGGMLMPAWYDIEQADLRRKHDVDGVQRSADQVTDLIRHEVDQGVPTEKIVLAGFSQGGAIALWLGLRFRQRLAGVAGLSTYLVNSQSLSDEASPHARSLPVFMAHGTEDPMVHHGRGLESYRRLQEQGVEVEWREYPMQHQVVPDEIADLGNWLRRVLTAGD